ncbi:MULTISPECIES: helix-turn-helix domain-containing protein [unclassified Streptomyces]|uniref:helix-turn-helix domain-containing protein n=1 Tax=unclassified Streptomyces TaxID=2593676 RepID=UPI001BE7B4D6|nr:MULTISPECIES: helix-turn-helix domain-containing protein [unclassified Streptomyces]MBT2402316.1 helix-turn-helix domain-containing protein [Streptomyces sp. ISL-21]MBT2606738.1 helix-turn-helix domain-containing protein [Streptomyces sp. ISL-87]
MEFHSLEVRQAALSLLRDGTRNADVARRLNVPLGTIGYWKHVDRAKRGECPGAHNPDCPRCDGSTLDTQAYAYLLGLYLGDGHISQYSRHRVPNLMITCDDKWPGLMDSAEQAMQRVFPFNQVCRVRKVGCHNVKVYSKHLECLFPQHGPGRKHERPITLEGWQQVIVDVYPWEFLRGLIHSDGCRITNWTVRNGKRYEYPRYFFTNKSDDIRKLCTDTLTKVGIQWTILARGSDPFNVSVARKGSVALMDAHIGPKH